MKYNPLVVSLAWVVSSHFASAATVFVTTTNNASGPSDGQISLVEAIQTAAAGDTIGFLIPGSGPHVIQTPLGGYPLITRNSVTIDGYIQPAALPNTNSILGGNNAQIRIVLDSTATNSAPNDPQNPILLARRSTRILHSGYGASDSGILAVLGADNFRVRGLAFIARHTRGTTNDPNIHAVALVNGATNARVQGCWFGLAPGGSTQADIKPPSSAVAAFRYDAGASNFIYSHNLVVGTDGDGVNDRAEFNVVLGCHTALALELPRARVSGNYINVFPNGTTFCNVALIHQQLEALGRLGRDASVESVANGGLADNTVIGINGDGVSDAEERNIIGHSVYHHDIAFAGSATNTVIAGNYFGVGIDGATPGPVPSVPDFAYNFVAMPSAGSIRIGSNGDGVSDDLEGNLIVNVSGDLFVDAGASVPIVARRNRMINNDYLGLPFAEGQNGRNYLTYYGLIVPDSSMVVPTLKAFANNLLSGTMIGPNGAEYIAATVDVYVVDPAALAKTRNWPNPITHTFQWLAAFTDNGPNDLDLSFNQFAFDLTPFGLADTNYVAVAVTYSRQATSSNAGQAVTSPMSNPISRRPTLAVRSLAPNRLELSWLAYAGAYRIQGRPTVTGGPIQDFTHYIYTGGRNIAELTVSPSIPTQFYRLISQ